MSTPLGRVNFALPGTNGWVSRIDVKTTASHRHICGVRFVIVVMGETI